MTDAGAAVGTAFLAVDFYANQLACGAEICDPECF
jgi:hypothetical protein